MNENYITKHIFLGYCLSFLLGVAITCCLLFRNYGTDTTSTISTIKEQQRNVDAEIRNASTNIGEAKNTVGGVSETINRVQDRLTESEQYAINNAREIDNLTTIVKECRSIAEQNRTILNEVGTTDN